MSFVPSYYFIHIGIHIGIYKGIYIGNHIDNHIDNHKDIQIVIHTVIHISIYVSICINVYKCYIDSLECLYSLKISIQSDLICGLTHHLYFLCIPIQIIRGFQIKWEMSQFGVSDNTLKGIQSYISFT